MNSRHIALWAVLAAATSWTAKSVAIGVAGGLDKSPLEGPLYFVGLIFFVVGVVALGIAATPRARTWLRIAAGAGAFVLGLALTITVDTVVGSFYASDADRPWVWVELNLWVAALAAVAVAVALNRPRQPRSRPL